MDFEREAWRAAAQTYGAARAEKYGRVYRAWRAVQVVMILCLAAGIVMLWHAR